MPGLTKHVKIMQRGHNTIWKVLYQIFNSPFSKDIERAQFSSKFTPPNYVMYDGRIDSMDISATLDKA
jgi:hypothetical protein